MTVRFVYVAWSIAAALAFLAAASVADVTPTAETVAVTSVTDAKLAEVDEALAELRAKIAEVEALKASLEQATTPAQPAAPKTERWKYSGYAQIQAYAGPAAEASGSNLQYQIRRFYHTFTYDIDAKTQGVITLNTAISKTGGRVAPLNAYVERTEGDARIRFGQFIPPATLDLIRSSSARHAHDYSRGIALLYPDQYEPGLMVSTYSKNTHAGQLSLMLMSGNGLNNPDNDNAKNWIVAYAQPFGNGKGKAVASYLSGTFTQAVSAAQSSTMVTNPKRLVSLGASWADGPWEFQAEGLRGESFGNSVQGYYLEAAYTTGRHTLFARHDVYDPNTSVAGNTWIGPSVGYEYNWNSRNRLSLEAGLFRDQATSGDDARWQARWQYKW